MNFKEVLTKMEAKQTIIFSENENAREMYLQGQFF